MDKIAVVHKIVPKNNKFKIIFLVEDDDFEESVEFLADTEPKVSPGEKVTVLNYQKDIWGTYCDGFKPL